ncbi:MAG TPA: 30S ribosome-binding factor RbfA [Chloroflexota bacterium]|nr:30S ribosome-binding factor RbfA [Chloroflexota bacterium]
MVSRRIARLNEQVRSDIAELITREMKDPRLAGLVSVTSVELSPDLRNARVFISVLGSDLERKQTLQAIRSAAGFLRTQLAARMTTKRAPELHFLLDTSIERGERIMHLIHQIEKEPKGEDEPND